MGNQNSSAIALLSSDMIQAWATIQGRPYPCQFQSRPGDQRATTPRPLHDLTYAMQTTSDYMCAYCGEMNSTFVDLSGGNQQSYIEDCQVCCRPNVLYIRIDEETLTIDIDTGYEE